MRNKKGITLISLIITIIILILLAYKLKDFIAPEGLVDQAVDMEDDVKNNIKEGRNEIKELEEIQVDLPNEIKQQNEIKYN